MDVAIPPSGEGVAAPADYAELHRVYYPYVVGLVRKLGIEPQNSEDVASAIMVRCFERDILAMFDSEFSVEHGGRTYKARFKSFLSSWVVAYVKHHRDQQTLRARREPLKCDEAVGDGTATWIEVYGPTGEDDYTHLEYEEMVAGIRAHLATLPRRSRQDICDLLALFNAVERHQRLYGRVRVKDLAGEFGVSTTAIHSWLGWMRINIRAHLEVRPGA